MRRSDTTHLYWITAAFVAVAVVFLTAAVIEHRAAAGIDEEVADLETNSIPSVTHLMNARSSLRRLEIYGELLVDPPPGSAQTFLDEAQRAHAGLHSEIEQFAETPWYPGERELFENAVAPQIHRLDAAFALMTALTREHAPRTELSKAAAELTTASGAADDAVNDVAKHNHVEADAAATRIRELRQRSVRLALALEVASSLLAVIAAALAIRVARRHALMLRETTELQTERAAELETFAQRVAHDLLSPLGTVMLALDAIRRNHGDDWTRDMAARATRSLGRSRDMVNGILTFARSGARPAQGARANVGAVVRAAVDELVAAEPESPPQVEIEPFDDVPVACDGVALGTVLANYLANAAKYTKDSPRRRITVRTLVGAKRVRVEVEDTGPGLPPSLVDTIFEPYVRAPDNDKPGLGLGLATAKRLALAYGGEVGVRKGDVGAVFWVDVPRAPATATAPAVSTQPGAPA